MTAKLAANKSMKDLPSLP